MYKKIFLVKIEIVDPEDKNTLISLAKSLGDGYKIKHSAATAKTIVYVLEKDEV